MKECSSRSRNPSRCFSFWLLISVFLSMVAISTIAQTRSADSSNILPKRGDQNQTSFTSTPAYPEAGESVQFTDGSQDQVISWEWDFGDGRTSNVRNPRHFYSKPGFYSVTLTTVGSFGKKRAKRTIGVMPPTDASFSYSPASPRTGQQVQFTDATSGSPTSWLWRFGDGTTSTSRNPSHAYRVPAPYIVTLLVGGISGPERASRTLVVSAATSAPTLASSFTHSPGSPAPGQAVQFTDTSGGPPTSWYWDFNDGSTSTVQNPNHTFAAAGTYNVTLTITNSTGSTSTSVGISVGLVEVIKAASPSFADVSAAVSRAKSGDTVIIPSGSAVWKNQLIITKSVSVVGAGINQTIITSGFTGTLYKDDDYLLCYNISNDSMKSFQLSGLTLDMGGLCEGLQIRNQSITPAMIRVDHISFQHMSTTPQKARAFTTWGQVWGVVDNCIFHFDDISPSTAFRVISPYGDNQTNWQLLPYEFGTADNLYFEDNVFYTRSMVATGGQGGRYAMRHNTFTLTEDPGVFQWYLLDLHGNYANNGVPFNWSGMGLEFYENTLYAKGHPVNFLDLRGGKALIYNNYIIDGSSQDYAITSKCREETPPAPDGNDSWCYPARHLINNQPQHVSDFYVWNSYKDGAKFISPTDQNPFIDGTLDYADPSVPGYNAKLAGYGAVPRKDVHFWREVASFNGSTGMGVGPLALRPPSCTLEGAAWWATDESKLYRWRKSKWELYYTPYTYPHPLRNR